MPLPFFPFPFSLHAAVIVYENSVRSVARFGSRLLNIASKIAEGRERLTLPASIPNWRVRAAFTQIRLQRYHDMISVYHANSRRPS